MFVLRDADLRRGILGCADGPASFNAEATRRGHRVVSCDPLYRFSAEEIRRRVTETAGEILAETRKAKDDFVWDVIPSVAALERLRLGAMETFLADFEADRTAARAAEAEEPRRGARYVDAELPSLPFPDGAFDLALCSHFLFLYSAQFDAEFHRRAIVEMCRVAGETRIFPLVALGGVPSPHVEPVADALRAAAFDVSIEPVPYEFQRGANQMLRVGRKDCQLPVAG